MQTSGDEMELLAAVNRKFRHIFARQEHMKAYRVYDIAEVIFSLHFSLFIFLFLFYFFSVLIDLSGF